MNRIVAIDPGRYKCGLVLTDTNAKRVLEGKVIRSDALINQIIHWQSQAKLDGLLLGNGTSSDQWKQRLDTLIPVQLIEERGTTLRARHRYWELWPPKGLRRWLPRGLILPPDDLDAVAALVMLEDHLRIQFNWTGPASFRNAPEP